jgi:hypothetical protein
VSVFDNGAPGQGGAERQANAIRGDGIYYAQGSLDITQLLGNQPQGDFFIDLIVTDRAGNSLTYDKVYGFSTEPFSKRANLLFVPTTPRARASRPNWSATAATIHSSWASAASSKWTTTVTSGKPRSACRLSRATTCPTQAARRWIFHHLRQRPRRRDHILAARITYLWDGADERGRVPHSVAWSSDD